MSARAGLAGLLALVAIGGAIALFALSSGGGGRGALESTPELAPLPDSLPEPTGGSPLPARETSDRGFSVHPFARADRGASEPTWHSAGCELEGRVESADGAPFPDVLVEVQLDAKVRGIGQLVDQIVAAQSGFASMRTDAEGRFAFRDLPRDPLIVRAQRTDGAQVERGQVRAAPPGTRAVALVLRFESGLDLRVEYRDREGRALAAHHLALLFNLEDEPLALRRWAMTTDEHGAAQVADLPSGRYTILAFPAPWSMQVLRDDLQLYADTTLALEAGATARLELLVRDRGGAPIAGARFFALCGGGRSGGAVYGTSGADGRITVLAAPIGPLNLALVHAAGFTGWPQAPQEAKAYEIRSGETCAIEATLAPLRAVRGRIVDAASGEGVADIALEFRAASDPRCEVCARARTDAEGRFAVAGLPVERVHVAFAIPGREVPAPRLAPLSLFAERNEKGAWDWIEITPGEGEQQIEIALPESGTLAGAVEDETGRPLRGARVVATCARRGFASRLEQSSDGEGRFAFRGLYAPAHWSLALERDGKTVVSLERDLAAGQDVSDLVLRCAAPRALRGRVRASGAPVAGARITLRPEGGERIQLASDATGAFDVPCGAERAALEVETLGHLAWRRDLRAEGSAFPFQEIEHVRAIELAGRVRDELGEPVAHARLRWDTAQRLPEGTRHETHARSDNAGEFRFARLLAGPGALRIELEGYKKLTQPIDDPASASPLDVVLSRGLGISGRVTLPDGSPAAATPMELTAPGGERLRATSAADGSFEITGLEDATYALVARANEAQRVLHARDSASTQVAAGTTGLAVELLLGAFLSGIVDAAAIPGVALQEARVEALDARGASQGAAGLDANGAFELLGLAPDAEYVLVLTGTGHALRRQAFGPFAAGRSDLRLQAQPGALLRGRVLDKDDRPVPGIEVTCVDGAGESPPTPPLSVRTTPDGSFQFVGCSKGAIRLVFRLPTSPPRTQEVANVYAGGDDLEIRVDL